MTQLEFFVSKCIINASYRWPKLATFEEPRCRKRCFLPGVWVRPFGCTDLALRVWCHLQRVVLRGPDALLNLLDFLANGNHGIAETVKLCLVLGLCRLNHEGMWNRPRH